ncbi:Threonine/homoserine/homoserine lactone efflux protein [Fontimonas thermophila]|uniref:Threonine/homoserine/homoserine lactone efflux protein n=1 Tax=Fontimonas thermophila TaxID=1076937 RepID=A0A1I2JS70_9GAMM|nr:LysE family translocator [Fontimonas thermophila]SFF55626.1 Threonine/homoserine/homoserine lactone efflux protein [Fontimonas thermophila]
MTFETGWALFGAVAAAHALGVVSPGPDFAVVTRQALTQGRAAGIWTAAGIGSGIVLHVGYGLFGLRWLTHRLPWSLDAIALIGAAFLLWMGSTSLRARSHDPDGETAAAGITHGNWRRHYALGLATNVLNPKATLFFVALFTSIVSAPVSLPMMVALAIWLPLSTFAWFAAVAVMLSHRRLQQALQRHAQRIDRAMGLILIALGLAVIADTLGG